MNNKNPISLARKNLTKGFIAIGVFSCALNLLMLASPIYMLQVYDRVLTSQNVETLIALTLLLGGVFVVIGALEFIRMRILNRLGKRFELQAGTHLLDSSMRRKVKGGGQAGELVLSDLSSVREVLGGQALLALFDMPWVPLYLFILFVLHPYLGLLGVIGTIILVSIAIVNNLSANKPLAKASQSRNRSDALFQTCEQNAELIQAMGMKRDLINRWLRFQGDTSYYKNSVDERTSTFSSISKTVRMMIQSGMLGLGAALVIFGEATAGVMIASTIILGRALSPIDQIIAQWRNLLQAYRSFKKIRGLAENFPKEEVRMNYPAAKFSLEVKINRAGPPLSKIVTLANVNFRLEAGDVMAVIGPSGSGKSTLARMLAGIWVPQNGDVLFDGVATSKWNRDDLGKQIGYLSQDVELFDGTIRDNIARFSLNSKDADVLKAARAGHVDDLINGFEEGYETQLGVGGVSLSGGQRQRIGLARAMYDDPFVIILDEPNSNLDATGDAALRNAVLQAKERGAIVIVMTHRPATLQAVNKVLVMQEGTQKAFGDKDDVLRATTRNINAIEKEEKTPKVA